MERHIWKFLILMMIVGIACVAFGHWYLLWMVVMPPFLAFIHYIDKGRWPWTH